MSSQIKSFEDVQAYSKSIPKLMPGHQLLHEMISCVMESVLSAPPERILVVGSGPGEEVMMLAAQFPNSFIDCIDPSVSMTQAARQLIEQAGIQERIQVHTCTLEQFQSQYVYDVVISTLVSHFVPDQDGQRLTFLKALRAVMHSESIAVITEFSHGGKYHKLLSRAHVTHSHKLGVPSERLPILRERLEHSFHSLSMERLDELLSQADLDYGVEFFRAWGVSGFLLYVSSTSEA